MPCGGGGTAGCHRQRFSIELQKNKSCHLLGRILFYKQSPPVFQIQSFTFLSYLEPCFNPINLSVINAGGYNYRLVLVIFNKDILIELVPVNIIVIDPNFVRSL